MLNYLHIDNFAVIERLELELDSGMTVLTGETGAGKSIAIDALGLAIGDRADTNSIRHGADRLDITANFAIDNNPAALEWLREHLLDGDDDQQVLLRRVVSSKGPSRAFINGKPATANQQKALGQFLVSIHGQHEHQSLLSTSYHRQLLDRYAGHDDLVTKVSEIAVAISATARQLDEQAAEQQQRRAARELLEYQSSELEPLVGEQSAEDIESMDGEHRRLSHASELLTATGRDLQDLYEGDSTLYNQLSQIVSNINELQRLDKSLEPISQMLTSALTEIQEAAQELRHYQDGVEVDDQRLHQLNEQLGKLHQLAKKYQMPVTELPEHYQALQADLAALAGEEQASTELTNALVKLQDEYAAAAKKLAASRRRHAKRLGKEIEQMMKGLDLADGRFEVSVTERDIDSYSADGTESVEFQVSTNPGQPPAPLKKVASGGELSRISLAIQVINARHGSLPCLIFDEVDVGIGGGTAARVGALLAELASEGQIICVTHQAQVAARGDHHYNVSKQKTNRKSETQMQLLDDGARVDEIARMIGGLEITEKTLSHARELLGPA